MLSFSPNVVVLFCILGGAVGRSQQTLESASADGEAPHLPLNRKADYRGSLGLILIKFVRLAVKNLFYKSSEIFRYL